MANTRQRKRKPAFAKVDQLTPFTNGHTLMTKVLAADMVPLKQKSWAASQNLRIAECLIGDETGTIVFTARNDQVDWMKPGVTVILRNAKVNLFKGFMRVAIDSFGSIEVIDPVSFVVDEDNNLSLIEYEKV